MIHSKLECQIERSDLYLWRPLNICQALAGTAVSSAQADRAIGRPSRTNKCLLQYHVAQCISGERDTKKKAKERLQSVKRRKRCRRGVRNADGIVSTELVESGGIAIHPTRCSMPQSPRTGTQEDTGCHGVSLYTRLCKPA